MKRFWNLILSGQRDIASRNRLSQGVSLDMPALSILLWRGTHFLGRIQALGCNAMQWALGRVLITHKSRLEHSEGKKRISIQNDYCNVDS